MLIWPKTYLEPVLLYSFALKHTKKGMNSTVLLKFSFFYTKTWVAVNKEPEQSIYTMPPQCLSTLRVNLIVTNCIP